MISMPLSIYSLLTLLFLFSERMTFPFELHWMEGGSVDHVQEILEGRSLYRAPSIEFTPYTYTPLYFYAAAFVAKLTGTGFVPLRMVSVASTIGLLILIVRLAYHYSKNSIASLVAAALYASSFGFTGFWFDTGRADSLLLFFLMAGFSLLVTLPYRPAAQMVAGAFIALAFFSKQVALPIAFPVIATFVLIHKRHSVPLLVSGGSVFLIGTVALAYFSDGWYWFYVYASPKYRWLHHLSLVHTIRVAIGEFLIPFAPTLLLSLAMSLKTVRIQSLKRDQLLLIAFCCGLAGGGVMGRLEFINYVNTLMPFVLSMSLIFGIALGKILAQRDSERYFGAKAQTIALCLMIAQFSLLHYDIADALPRDSDYNQGRTFLAEFRDLPGQPWLADHGYLPLLAGKVSLAHSVGLADVMRGNSGIIAQALETQVQSALANKSFSFIISDSGVLEEFFSNDLNRFYRLDNSFSLGPVPVLGYSLKPRVYRAR